MFRVWLRWIRSALNPKSLQKYKSASDGQTNNLDEVVTASCLGHVQLTVTDSAYIYDFANADDETVLIAAPIKHTNTRVVARVPMHAWSTTITPSSAIAELYIVSDGYKSFQLLGFDSIEFILIAEGQAICTAHAVQDRSGNWHVSDREADI